MDKEQLAREQAIEKKQKQNEMARILATIFLNFKIYKLDSSLREVIEEGFKDSPYEYGNISYADIAEFMFQVGGCIFCENNEEKNNRIKTK